MKKLFGVVITTVVAIVLLPVITTAITDLTGEGGDLNGTTVAPLLDLVPLLYVASAVIGGFIIGAKF